MNRQGYFNFAKIREIEQNVMISNMEGNLIKQGSEGIYIEQTWASWDEFNKVKELSDNAYEYIDYIMDVLYDDLVVITDEEILDVRINEIINNDLSNMRKVVNYARNIDNHARDYKGYIDNYQYMLKGEFSDFSPFSWIEFDH